MRILLTVALLTLVAPNAIAQIASCEDYAGVPCPISVLPTATDYISLVAVGDDLCAIASYYHYLQGWHVDAGGVPQLGGIYEPTDGRYYGQLAVHGDRVYGAAYDFGVIIHEMVDATPVPVDSILVTRTSHLVAVVDDLLITNHGNDKLLIFDLTGPAPVLTDSLYLPDLALGSAYGAGGLAVVQTTSPPCAHVLDPATGRILGAVDIPWNTRTVSWDGRLALLNDIDREESYLLDVSDPVNPVVRPLPLFGDMWLVGGTLVEGDLWLSGCDFVYGGVLARFDMTDPVNPGYLGKQQGGGGVAEAVNANGFVHALTLPLAGAFAMCTPWPPSLESTRIGTPDPLPTRIGYLYDSDLDAADHAALTGDLLCRLNGYRLQIVDFGDLVAPVLRSDVVLSEHLFSESIHTSGSRVVVAGSGSGVASVGGRIFVYDISAPDTPSLSSTTICMRFTQSTLDGDRLYTWGVDDDLYVWRLEDNNSVTLLVEHTNLIWDEYTELLAYDRFLFSIDDTRHFHGWDFIDPYAPVELSGLPTGEVNGFYRLQRWDGGIYWYGRSGPDQYAHELMTIEPEEPWTVRLVWHGVSDVPTWLFGGGFIDAGDRMYLGGPGILALDLQTDPPTVLGMIPAFEGWFRLVNGYPVVEHNNSVEVWAPACGTITGAPVGPPPARCTLDAWPNPFNPRLTVAFALPESGLADVAVYDLRGRRLRALTQGFREAGRHVLQWDGRDEAGRTMAAGVYVVRLEQAERTATRLVTMVK